MNKDVKSKDIKSKDVKSKDIKSKGFKSKDIKSIEEIFDEELYNEKKNRRIKVNNIYEIEEYLWSKGYNYIAGCDEVGRGPMAGPLVVASVVLDKNERIEGLNDSKKLTAKRREELAKEIKEKALFYSITYIDVEEVDRINVLEASRKGMCECLKKLKEVDFVLTDCMVLDIDKKSLSIIKGDATSASIAASSIVAKVERDNFMIKLAETYPLYGFDNHKGYVTKYHLDMIDKYGICKYHRKSFDPVRKIIERDKKEGNENGQ
ncbi:MAG: ribonuclease HII [Bacilli bacterium]|nr:ribonuclease HII [Bacilli bacterium]